MLPRVEKYCLEKLVDENVNTILLIGSWAKGISNDNFDIDLIVIRDAQLVDMYNEQINEDDFSLDIWYYDERSLYSDLQKKPEDLNKINTVSLTLLGLSGAKVIFDRNNTINKLFEIVSNWKWPEDTIKLLEFETEAPSSGWQKRAYEENIKQLEIGRECIKNNLPFTHRRKDYPELLYDTDEENVMQARELIKSAYNKLGISVQWSEWRDFEKAIRMRQWAIAFATIKDVARFILRYDLPSVPLQNLDPRIWHDATITELSPEVNRLMEHLFQE